MKKIILLILLPLTYVSCDNSKKITLTKLEGSPPYFNAKISTASITLGDENEYTFTFDVSDYELGAQTINNVESQLANSDKGQHIHFIVNNGPYSAHYINNFKKKLNKKNNAQLLVFEIHLNFQKQIHYFEMVYNVYKDLQWLWH